MQIIAFARSLAGILFVLRTMHAFRGRGLVGARALEFTGVTALILIGLIEFVVAHGMTARLIATTLAAAAPLAVYIALERNQIAGFRAHVPLFLDRWILNMRLGASTSAARASAMRSADPRVAALLAPVFESSEQGRRRHLILTPAVLRELAIISRTNHAALDRLGALRTHVRESSEFRRKSGQAVRQAVIQSVVMLIMLVALSVYTIIRYGWSRSGWFVTGAALLSTLGTLLMVALARKRRWTL